MTIQDRRYRTSSSIVEDCSASYIFVPHVEEIWGVVHVKIITHNMWPVDPKTHPKINAALLMAHHFHPNHVVLVRLESLHAGHTYKESFLYEAEL